MTNIPRAPTQLSKVSTALLLSVCILSEATSGETIRVSVDSAGNQGNSVSGDSDISADGRIVVFESQARNLVPNDTNRARDVFVHDVESGTTRRVSVDSAGRQANGRSNHPAISRDGRFVTFWSEASNLVPQDTNNTEDVFVHEIETGMTTRVSVASDGTQGNGQSLHPDISADGRYVAFDSNSSNLVRRDTNSVTDTFLRDRQTGMTTRVSVTSNGQEVKASSSGVTGHFPAISDDGRFVAFVGGGRFVEEDGNRHADVYVHDRLMGTTTRASVSSSGRGANSYSGFPLSISGDGRFVAFTSHATNLVPSDINSGEEDVFVHDRVTGETELVSVSSTGEQGDARSKTWKSSLSRDGRFVTFRSDATNLVPGDSNQTSDLFIHDRKSSTTVRLSVDAAGNQLPVGSFGVPALSANADAVSFYTLAALVPGDTNRTEDVYRRQLVPRVVAGPVVNPISDNDYYLLERSTWTDAHKAADRMGGHLVTIDDGDENRFVFDTFMPVALDLSDRDDPNLWIGLSDASSEGDFEWTSSTPVAFTNWDAGEPNDILGNEDYGLMSYLGGGVWNDAANDAPPHMAYGLVEVVPAPPTPQLANSLVTFEPGVGTYLPGAGLDGCPTGSVGRYYFDATLANVSQYPLLNINLGVKELSNENRLWTPDGTIGVGELYAVPLLDDYDDGMLAPNESIAVHFRICITTKKTFRFFVDVFAATVTTIKVEAHIDGRSQLVLQGDTARWYHLDYAAPGRHLFQNKPTVISGIDWYPHWPDVPNEENRGCNCFSDTISGLTPELPKEDFGVTLRPIKNRHVTKVVQYPNAANGYALIIEFDDNPRGGSEDYIVDIQLRYEPGK